MVVDRIHRDLLVETIDRYLHEEITAFELDDAIFAIRDQTRDETVRNVVDYLWLFYDDCDDHQVILDRVGWNCIQRMKLLLKSDAHLECFTKRIWTGAQIIAAVALAAFGWFAYQTGIGEHLLVVAIPFGLVSIGLSSWRSRLYRNASNYDPTLSPFTSVGQLLWVGQGVSGFRKEKYPAHVGSRRIHRTLALPLWAQYPFWLLYSPVILLVQLLPVRVPIRRVDLVERCL